MSLAELDRVNLVTDAPVDLSAHSLTIDSTEYPVLEEALKLGSLALVVVY